jgi:DNA mismatch repair protein MutL
VNVHPTKVEVRFRDSQRIYSQLFSTIRNTFLSSDLHSRLQAPESPTAPAPAPAAGTESGAAPPRFNLAEAAPDRQAVASWFVGDPSAPGFQSFPSPGYAGGPPPSGWGQALPPRPSNGPAEAFDEFASRAAEDSSRPDQPAPVSTNSSEPPIAAAGDATPQRVLDAIAAAQDKPLKALQVHDSYLIAETSDGMMVIDQHALHERILYEELRVRVEKGRVESQRLLVPDPVHLTAAEASLVLEQQAVLGQLGLEIEPFGGDTVLVVSAPVMLQGVPTDRLLRDLAEHLRSRPLPPTRDALLADLLHMVACKAAVKAGQRLTPEEIGALLERRHLVADAHHCPHGRPTALVFTKSELERQFGRI